MLPPEPARPPAPLYIDAQAIARLARRCVAAAPVLPGLDDADVRRFVQMARRIDPRPMLLDAEFELRLRFDLFTDIVAPLGDLVRCYGQAIDRAPPGDADVLSIYCDVLTLSIRTLCAGLELFAAVRASAGSAGAAIQATVDEACAVFETELSVLLLRVTQVLGQPAFQAIEEARALTQAVDQAMLRLPALPAHAGRGPG